MTDEHVRKALSKLRVAFSDNKAPAQPTFGMRWIEPSTGLERCYVQPGNWRPVKGEPVGSWTIDPAITDAAVVTTLNDLKDLLLSAGIIE